MSRAFEVLVDFGVEASENTAVAVIHSRSMAQRRLK